jgi:hypothetical protein
VVQYQGYGIIAKSNQFIAKIGLSSQGEAVVQVDV